MRHVRAALLVVLLGLLVLLVPIPAAAAEHGRIWGVDRVVAVTPH